MGIMGKEKEKEKEKDSKLFVGVVWNCATEIKIVLAALLFLCSLAIILQFLPSRLSLSSSDLRLCISKLSSSSSSSSSNSTSTSTSEVPQPVLLPSSSSPPPLTHNKDQIIRQGIIKRAFNSYGSAAYTFIQMGSYRGGLNTFAIIGLASKPLIVYGKPSYQCQWISNNNTNITTFGSKILPDWGYGRVYTVVVINCIFPIPIGTNGSGGRLILHASDGVSGNGGVVSTEKIEALVEAPGSLNASVFSSPPVYDYFYCGSPLYGDLSPQRMREWIAYHVKLFGEKSHFVIHDAGGVHSGVLEVLKPWIEKGYVTLQDVREQERFDGYYHNQFLVVNDCLHRYRFMAKWMFFFDVDEYIYVQPESTIQSIVDEYSGYNQFTIEQVPMSNKLCLASDAGKTEREWGFEKLVYRDVQRGIRRDRKYAIQPRNTFATGVHMSQNVAGKTLHRLDGRIKYFHYHGTISERRELCRQLVNETHIYIEKKPYMLDTTLRDAASAVKSFEIQMIGSQLQRTQQ